MKTDRKKTIQRKTSLMKITPITSDPILIDQFKIFLLKITQMENIPSISYENYHKEDIPMKAFSLKTSLI